MATPTPQEIAREAVKLLAARRLPPTPDNFQSAYHEVAGTRPLQPFPLLQLRQIAQALPERTPAQVRFKALFNKAVSRHSWEDLEKLLTQHLASAAAPPPVNGAREERDAAPPTTPTAAPTTGADAAPIAPDIAEQTARIVDIAQPLVAADDARLEQLGSELVQYLRLPDHHAPTLRRLLADYAWRLSFGVEEQLGVREGLLALLRQVLEQLDALSPDNPWLQQQLQALVQAAQPPLSKRRLEDLHGRLKDVIVKQVQAREQTLQAQELMRQTLATFLERLAQTADATSQYHSKFEACAQRLEQATSLAEMAPVVQEAIQTARAFATDTQRVADELTDLRDRASRAEAEVQRLQRELDQMAELVTPRPADWRAQPQGVGVGHRPRKPTCRAPRHARMLGTAGRGRLQASE
jgi:diguanylate cyclase